MNGTSEQRVATISLGVLLLVALLARVPAVLFSEGYFFRDEQYQYIDPAWHLASGDSWWKPEDYMRGIRSWIYPGMLAALFRVATWFGLEDPIQIARFGRGFHAILSLIPVASLWLLLRWKGIPAKRWFLLFATCNFLAVFAGVRMNAPGCAAGFALAAIFLFQGPRLWPLLAGLCLGIAFTFRFQDAFFGPVLFLAGVATKRYRAIWLLSLGAAFVVVAQGLLDFHLYGRFLHSAFAYVEFNVFEGRNGDWGREPWWYYIAAPFVLLLAVPPFLGAVWRELWAGTKAFPVLMAACVVYLFLHSAPEHKSPRFVIPAILLLWTVYAWRLFDGVREERWQRFGHRWTFLSVHLVAWVAFTFYFWNRGPVDAALRLGQEPQLEEIWVVDGSQDSIGGHFHLQRRTIEVETMPRFRLKSTLEQVDWQSQQTPIHLMVAPEELEADRGRVRRRTEALDLEMLESDHYEIRLLGAYRDWPVIRKRNLRWCYRVTPK